MYTVSALWETLVAGEHWFETKVAVNNVEYGEDELFEVTVNRQLFNEEHPVVGACIAAELNVSMLMPSVAIPRMAKVEPFVRVTDGDQTSEWIPQGVFYIDTRETTKNNDGLDILSLHCYDPMLKTEADYPNTTHDWPYTDIDVVSEIAGAIGVGIDTRTIDAMTGGYEIGLPAGYSMREVLGNIAAMYAGNWVMNYDGDLLLVSLGGIPSETNYLVTDAGEPITFGGDKILV